MMAMRQTQTLQGRSDQDGWYRLLAELDPIDVLVLESVYHKAIYASRFIKRQLPRQSPRTVERRIRKLAERGLLRVVGQRPLVVSPILPYEPNIAVLCREVRKAYGVSHVR